MSGTRSRHGILARFRINQSNNCTSVLTCCHLAAAAQLKMQMASCKVSGRCAVLLLVLGCTICGATAWPVKGIVALGEHFEWSRRSGPRCCGVFSVCLHSWSFINLDACNAHGVKAVGSSIKACLPLPPRQVLAHPPAPEINSQHDPSHCPHPPASHALHR